jgi:glycosyltransferase involved in cell wall biosynthesis
MPRVSICIPTYNGSRFIAEALESARAQTHSDLEILVVDDGSSDNTVEIADGYARTDARIKVHRNSQNLGLPKNWDRCRELASGEWTTFLFHDDLLRQDCVEKMVASAVQHSVPLVCCRRSFSFFSEVPQATRERFLRYIEAHSFARYFPGRSLVTAREFSAQLAVTPLVNFVGEPTAVMLHRSTLADFGHFHVFMKQLVDFEYWARIAVHTGIAYVDEPLITFRIHTSSATEMNRQHVVRKDRLDSIVLLHDYLHSTAYESLRRTLTNRIRLLRHYSERTMQLQRDDRTRDLADPSWTDALGHYPQLGRPSLSSRVFHLAYRSWDDLKRLRRPADSSSQGVN